MSSLSITTMTMFETFGCDMNFPPIIGSSEYKKSKYLGLCQNQQAVWEEEQKKLKAEETAEFAKDQAELQQQTETVDGIPPPPLNIAPPGEMAALPPGVPPPPPIAILNNPAIPPPPPLNAGKKEITLKPLPGGIPPPPMLDPGKLVQNFEQKKKEAEDRGEKLDLGGRCKFMIFLYILF